MVKNITRVEGREKQISWKFCSLIIVKENEYLEFYRNYSGIEFSNSAFSSKIYNFDKISGENKGTQAQMYVCF